MKRVLSFLGLFIFVSLSPILLAEEINYDELNEFVKQTTVKDISLDVTSVPLSRVLKAISLQTGLSFIAEKEIANDPITLYVKGVEVLDVMKLLLKLYNYTCEYDKGTDMLIIKKRKKKEDRLETKVFHLEYAVVPGSRIVEKAKKNTSLTSGEVDTGDAGNATGGLSGEGLFNALEAVLTEQGRAVCDPRTNSIIVTDLGSNMKNIETLIRNLDKPVPQIMIQVDMLDVSRSVVDSLGIEWPENLMGLTAMSRTTKFPFLGRDRAFWPGASRSGSYSSFSFGGWLLNFLTTKTDAKYLARPKIFTLNGETAKIDILTNEVIGIVRHYNDNGNLTSEEPERYNTGLYLEVTPSVNMKTREVTMVVIPKLVETKPSKVSGLQNSFRDPEERGVRSVVRVLDGHTIVLGGLIKKYENDIKKKVPGLGDILKGLFSSKDNEKSERELLVFLTPHILDHPGDEGIKSLSPSEEDERISAMKKALGL